MREIRFRAWDEDEKMMVQWNELRDTQLFNDGFDNDHCVLMQFTGLKDKNGKEIYEGDIMEYYSGMVPKGENPIKKEIVKWNKRFARFDNCFSGGAVIGNIYENPELIGG